MLNKGNGTPQQCVANLTNLYQYEVPYARLKGMDPNIIDLPQDEAERAAKNHLNWLISNFEPRVIVRGVDVQYVTGGKMILKPDIVVKK